MAKSIQFLLAYAPTTNINSALHLTHTHAIEQNTYKKDQACYPWYLYGELDTERAVPHTNVIF